MTKTSPEFSLPDFLGPQISPRVFPSSKVMLEEAEAGGEFQTSKGGPLGLDTKPLKVGYMGPLGRLSTKGPSLVTGFTGYFHVHYS